MHPFSRCGAALLALFLITGCQQTPKTSAPPPQRVTPPIVGAAPASKGRLEIPNSPSAVRPVDPRPPVSASPTPATETAAGSNTVIRATAPSQLDPPTPPKSGVQPPAERKPPGDNGVTPPGPAPGETKPTANPNRLRELYNQAALRADGIHDYIARFRRREVVNAKPQAEDLMLMRFRKTPFSVYFKWLEGTANEGREVIFVKGMFNNQIQTRTGRGDFIPGMRVQLDPQSPRATNNSRRTIDEAGLHNLVQRFGGVLAGHEDGTRTLGTLQYIGPQQRPESPVPFECVAQIVPAGSEKHLLQGGTRYWFFNMDTQAKEFGLPVLLLTLDENRREVEYYFFDRFNINVNLRQDDFDPDVLWARGRR